MFRILLSLFFINVSFAQQTDKVDFIKCHVVVTPFFSDKSIYGNIYYEFEVKNDIDTIRIDA